MKVLLYLKQLGLQDACRKGQILFKYRMNGRVPWLKR